LAWGGRQFDATDEAALHQLATVGTIAWNNAIVYERQHEISLTFQQSLLPEAIPDIPGLSIATRYEPSAPSLQVGGDWYDVIELSGGQIGLVVGDVMGHGIRAASVMGQLRLALRAYAIDGYGTAEVIDRVDRLLGRLDGSQYATTVYAVIHPESGQIEIVNAGHPQPLLLDPSGHADFINAGRSTPLGIGLPGRARQEESFAIQSGSMLFLYSDGLIESRDRPIDEGMARLRSVATNFDGSPEEFCNLVLATVTDTTLQDDVCLLAVHLD
ncbi:MAG: serine/threonine-protein phosphatase, partial [Acidimicrobiaceae bacterium]|nr:serine/threonine-protein phosphatase [Acidimicrobiaceae bacterium]